MPLIYPAGAVDAGQLKPLLEAAGLAAEAAAGPTPRYFRPAAVGLTAKANGSPVTHADREAEAVIRARLAGGFSRSPTSTFRSSSAMAGRRLRI